MIYMVVAVSMKLPLKKTAFDAFGFSNNLLNHNRLSVHTSKIQQLKENLNN